MHVPLTFQFITKRLFLPDFFHFVDHAHKSPSAHPLQRPQQLSSLYHLPFLFVPHFTQLLLHHNSHTINCIFSRPPQLICTSIHPQHTSTLSYPSHLQQTTYIILFLHSSQSSPLFPLTQPMFHIPTHALKCPSGLPSYC